MSQNLQSTIPGGESDQYSSQKTFTQPHSKSQGQFGSSHSSSTGDASTGTKEASSRLFPTSTGEEAAGQNPSAERAERTAENVRYGQGISENGFGGRTGEVSGGADEAGANEGSAGRAEQGYGGKTEMRDDIGA